MSTNSNPASLSLMDVRNLSFRLGEVKILDSISFQIPENSCIGIVGNRGAGKSTLLKVLSGVMKRSGGSLFFAGKELGQDYNTELSSRLGIHAIYQEPMIIPSLNAWQNIFLNRELKRGLWYDHSAMHQRVQEAFKVLSVQIDPDIPLEYYSRDQQLMVEFARIFIFKPKLVLVDDVLSALVPSEQEKVFSLYAALRSEKTSIVYFSNNFFKELNMADRIFILDSGKIVDSLEPKDNSGKLQVYYANFFTRNDLEIKNIELFQLNLLHECILNSIPVPMCVTNPKNEIIYINDALLFLLGVERNQIQAKGIENLFRSSNISIQDLLSDIELRKDRAIHNIQIAVGDKQNSVSIRYLPITRKDTHFGMLFLFYEQRNASQLAESRSGTNPDDLFAQVMAKIFHEINNPLGIILNHMQLIKTSLSLEEVRSSIFPIENEIERIKRIVSSLCQSNYNQVVKKSEGDYPLSFQTILEDLIFLLEPVLTKNSVTIRVRPAQPINLRMKEDEIRQVLLNMIINSIEAMPGGGVITIHYGKTRYADKPYLFISIQDTGLGIKPEIKNRIFDLFFSTKTEQEKKGIGLTICKDIIEGYGGEITVASEEGKGAVFTIYLPEENV